MKGFKNESVHHNISLYVDDVLLFFWNSQTCLSENVTLLPANLPTSQITTD